MVVAGGGFFVLKGQSKPDKPKVELAEKETDLDEFLTNSADPNVYVRAKLTVRLSKDYDETKFKGNTGDIRDAVINVLNSTQPRDITDSTKRGGNTSTGSCHFSNTLNTFVQKERFSS